jgi:ABC-type amino acid transport substrate-binding protein
MAPFAMLGPDGQWQGLAVELWREIARDLGLEFRFVGMDLTGLLAGMADGSLDVGVSALTVTAERERVMDFSHAFFRAGLGIAVSKQGADDWLGRLWQVFTSRPMAMLGFMFLVMVLAGVVIWLVERKRNPEHFGGTALKGMSSGLWWAAQTIATVGYGDKTLQTTAGRMLGLFWMLASLVIAAFFGAVVTSSLTLAGLEGKVRGQQDLDTVRVGVVAHSSGQEYLAHQRYNFRIFPDLHLGAKALLENKVDAVVFDQPSLRYLATKEFPGLLTVLPDLLQGDNYALAFTEKSSLREPVNQSLLKILRGDRWRDMVYQYLGQGEGS